MSNLSVSSSINSADIQHPNVNDSYPVEKASLPEWSKPSIVLLNVERDEKNDVVSYQKANEAFARILQAFKADDGTTLNQIEKVSINDMIMLAANLSLKVFGDTANAAAKASKLMTDTQVFLRDQRVKEFQKQLAKQIEQSERAQRWGIFAAIFDWIIGAVEAVYGAFKLIEGAARIAVGDVVGGSLAIASGSSYLFAGIAGIVKAAAETAIFLGADKNKCQEVADIAGNIQLGAELVGMTLDIFQAGRAISATKAIAKTAGETMKEAAPKLVEAVVKNSPQEISSIAQKVGQQVSEQIAEQISKQVISGVEKGLEEVAKRGGQIAKALSEAFSQKAIQTLVTQSVEKIATQAIEKGVQITAEELTKQVTKLIRNEVIKQAIKACTFVSLNVAYISANAGKTVTSGIISIEKAKLQKQIETLILEQNFMEFCFDWYDKAKEQQGKTIKDLLSKQSDTLEGVTKTISETGMLQARIASSTV
ncbi:MAG TPA: type III secretion system translocon subunit SctE [Arsenophonus sp.]